MARRLLRVSVLTMLTFSLLLGGGPVRADVAHTDPTASVSALPESCSIQAGGNFALCSTIAFTSSRDFPNLAPGSTPRERNLNSAEIYLMDPVPEDLQDPTKQNRRRLTNNEKYDGFPGLSPDGKKIVFDSNRLGRVLPPPPPGETCGFCQPYNNVDLFVMDLEDYDGVNPIPDDKHRHLTQGGSSTWDPRGKYVAYHASKSGMKGQFKSGSASTATVDSDIFVVNVDDCRKVIESTGVKDCREIPGEHVKNITNSPHLTGNPQFPGYVNDDPDWSPVLPDGTQKIVFTRHPDSESVEDSEFAPGAEIWVMRVNPDGTPVQDGTENPKQLTFTADPLACANPSPDPLHCAEERAPTWSADGTRIAFGRRTGYITSTARIVTARMNTWVMNADGTNQVQLRFSPELDGPASWSPVGARILFEEGPPTSPLQLFLMNPDGMGVTQLTNQAHSRDTNAFATWGLLRVRVKDPKETLPARAPAPAPVPNLSGGRR